MHRNGLDDFGFTVNHRADLFCSFPAEGLIAASDADHSQNANDKNVLPVNSEHLLNQLFPAPAGMTDWAYRHVMSFWKNRSIRAVTEARPTNVENMHCRPSLQQKSAGEGVFQ